jgi:hypothetical protein
MSEEFITPSQESQFTASPVQVNPSEISIGRFGAYVRTTANSTNTAGSVNWITDLTSGITNPPFSFSGVVSEVIVFDRKLSPEERRKVYAYLSQKYRLENKLPDGFDSTRNSAAVAGTTYWVVENHPNIRDLRSIPRGSEFSGITIESFLKMPQTIYRSEGTALPDGTLLGGDTYEYLGA